MHKRLLLLATCALLACSDSAKNAPAADAGTDPTPDAWVEEDAGDEQDAGSDAATSALERPIDALPRPPAGKLPDDLKPPRTKS